jgi:vacuolar-type H+-ATPase subunit H
MGKHTKDGESDRVDAAFNRVLAAEAHAREQVEECRSQAAALLAAAEERARRIASQADGRMRQAHQIADAGVERVLAELRAVSVEDAPDGLSAEALTRLEGAIGALVAEILGPETGGEP